MLRSLKQLKDSFLSTLPVLLVVFVLFITGLVPFSTPEIVVFAISAVLVIVGMWLFNIGAESSMGKIGELVGSSVTKKQKMAIIVIVFFLFGLFITVAEPDLSVLASQVPIDSVVLIVTIGVGVGFFMVIGALRILLQKSLKIWLLGFYGLMFALACLIDSTYIPLSMDSGGVTTGPMTVPFLLACGIGIAASRSGGKRNSDSFGLVAFASIGPILIVMILSLVLTARKQAPTYIFERVLISGDSGDISTYVGPFINSLLPKKTIKGSLEYGTLLQVLISIVPIVVCFLIYNFIFLKLTGRKLFSTLSGVFYVYAGLVLFMTAVNAGFMPIGQKLGYEISLKGPGSYWLLILIGALLGVAAVFAEPAVQVLTNQIETVSDGNVKKSSVLIALAIGNGIAIVLSVLRIIYKVSLLYFVVPGYVLAFLLTFFVPDIYIAIAFDSGGVVSGPMNTTFILPYTIGTCASISGIVSGQQSQDIFLYAFGTVALVALAPILSIQLIGLTATLKNKRYIKISRSRIRDEFDDQIIHF